MLHTIADAYIRFNNLLSRYGLARSQRDAVDYAIPLELRDFYADQQIGDLAELFFRHSGHPVNKWIHYLPIYEKHFKQFRNKPIRMLEIGVSLGGSLEIWRKYLGPNAILFGVDIDSRCAGFVEAPNQFRLGSQGDAKFLCSVVEEMKGVDLVLDDGSHRGRHQIASFKALFPLLSEDGLYVMEDLHTSYWHGSYSGGFRRARTGIEFAKTLVDGMHHWYHAHGKKFDGVDAVHFYDSMVVIEKRTAARPGHLSLPA